MRLTVRPHTPPWALRSFQNSWLACTIGLPSGANTPERSVRRPSVIVLSVTPGPVFTAPDEPPPLLDALLLEPLLPQPAARTSTMQTTSEPARDFVERLMQCSPWLELTGHERGRGHGRGARCPRSRTA